MAGTGKHEIKSHWGSWFGRSLDNSAKYATYSTHIVVHWIIISQSHVHAKHETWYCFSFIALFIAFVVTQNMGNVAQWTRPAIRENKQSVIAMGLWPPEQQVNQLLNAVIGVLVHHLVHQISIGKDVHQLTLLRHVLVIVIALIVEYAHIARWHGASMRRWWCLRVALAMLQLYFVVMLQRNGTEGKGPQFTCYQCGFLW